MPRDGFYEEKDPALIKFRIKNKMKNRHYWRNLVKDGEYSGTPDYPYRKEFHDF